MINPFEISAKLREGIPPERLEAYGIDHELVWDVVMSGRLESIVALSNRLLEDTIENRRLPPGRAKVVRPVDAKLLTVGMLRVCCFFGRPLPDCLLRLNEMLLDVDRQQRTASKASAKKNKAFLVFIENSDVGVREVARKVGVSPGTASGWRKEFDRLLDRALKAKQKET